MLDGCRDCGLDKNSKKICTECWLKLSGKSLPAGRANKLCYISGRARKATQEVYDRAKQYRIDNKIKLLSYDRERNKNPVRKSRAKISKRLNVLNKYGLDFQSEQALLSAQKNKCAICGDSFLISNRHLDHDYQTSMARGFLCSRCNNGLGMFSDTVDGLNRAINYLKAPPAKDFINADYISLSKKDLRTVSLRDRRRVLAVGISGFATSGKDTIADYLVLKYDFKKISFADPIRESLIQLNPIINPNGLSLKDAIDEIGWTSAKSQYPMIRTLLQKFGTDVGRNIFGDSCWIDLAVKSIGTSKKIVFSDVRFENEIDLVNSFNSYLIKVIRPNVGSINNHISDNGLSDNFFDFVVSNDSTISELHDKIDCIAMHFKMTKFFK